MRDRYGPVFAAAALYAVLIFQVLAYQHAPRRPMLGSTARFQRQPTTVAYSEETSQELMEVLYRNHPAAVDRELARGADPNYVDKWGATPLLVAAGLRGSRQMTAQLLEAGAAVDRAGRWYQVGFIGCPVGEERFSQTALALASASGHVDVDTY